MSAVWTCSVSGPVEHSDIPRGADLPMRWAVRVAYREVTGQEETHLSSGWGGVAHDDTDDEHLRAIESQQAEIARLREALDELVAIVEGIDGCAMEEDAGGPVCRTHYSQPVDDACYFVHQARAALTTAKAATA